jgi:hypothetical protein
MAVSLGLSARRGLQTAFGSRRVSSGGLANAELDSAPVKGTYKDS